jgi:hypothetical protein
VSKHTAGKLSINEFGNVLTENGERLRVVGLALAGGDFLEESEANSARLVLCWNSHDKLVAALKALVNEMQYHNPGGTTKPQLAALSVARAALANAGGER